MLHTVSGRREKRIRLTTPAMQAHVWKHLTASDIRHISGNVYTLDLQHTWAQLAANGGLTLMDLIVIGDAIVMGLAEQRRTSPQTALRQLAEFIEALPRFKGRQSCRQALALMRANVLSPKESEARVGIETHGLPQGECNARIPEIVFGSGIESTLDIAWVEYRVGVEYDGDHHRTSKTQWARDNEKRSNFQSHGWIIIVATAADLADEDSMAMLAFRIARHLHERGARFEFYVVAISVDALAKRRMRG